MRFVSALRCGDGRGCGLWHTPYMVQIFGTERCPYTRRAREDYSRRQVDFEFVDVSDSDADLERMLGYSNGRRQVPVIVEDGKVEIGFGGT